MAEAEGESDRCREHLAAAVLQLIEEARPERPVSQLVGQQIVALVHDWVSSALAPDLESFMQHARRSIVGLEDVCLAARKNATTRALVRAEATRMQREKGAAPKRQPGRPRKKAADEADEPPRKRAKGAGPSNAPPPRAQEGEGAQAAKPAAKRPRGRPRKRVVPDDD